MYRSQSKCHNARMSLVSQVAYVLNANINRMPVQTSSEPASKKRKLAVPNGSQNKNSKNASFTEVLEKLKEDAKESGGNGLFARDSSSGETSFLNYLCVFKLQKEARIIGLAHLCIKLMRRRIQSVNNYIK